MLNTLPETTIPDAVLPSWIDHTVNKSDLEEYQDMMRLAKLKLVDPIPPALSEARSSIIKNKPRVLSELEYFNL
jgi:hypothetical protein